MLVQMGTTMATKKQRVQTPDGTQIRIKRYDDGLMRTFQFSASSGQTLAQIFLGVTSAKGAFAVHSAVPPLWVECDSAGMAMLLSEHYKCPVGRPDWWKDGTAFDPATAEAFLADHQKVEE